MASLQALFSDPTAWAALFALVVMEVVLGIDNLIFISILSNKLPPEHRQRTRRIGETGTGFVPLTGFLQYLDIVKIDAVEQDARRVQSAEPLLDPLVDVAVIVRRRFPTHAADQADRLHDALPGLKQLQSMQQHDGDRQGGNHANQEEYCLDDTRVSQFAVITQLFLNLRQAIDPTDEQADQDAAKR